MFDLTLSPVCVIISSLNQIYISPAVTLADLHRINQSCTQSHTCSHHPRWGDVIMFTCRQFIDVLQNYKHRSINERKMYFLIHVIYGIIKN